jgi:hypothetical protein
MIKEDPVAEALALARSKLPDLALRLIDLAGSKDHHVARSAARMLAPFLRRIERDLAQLAE